MLDSSFPHTSIHHSCVFVFSDRGSNMICALRDEESLNFIALVLNTVLRNTFDEKKDCPSEITALLNAVRGTVRYFKKTACPIYCPRD